VWEFCQSFAAALLEPQGAVFALDQRMCAFRGQFAAHCRAGRKDLLIFRLIWGSGAGQSLTVVASIERNGVSGQRPSHMVESILRHPSTYLRLNRLE